MYCLQSQAACLKLSLAHGPGPVTLVLLHSPLSSSRELKAILGCGCFTEWSHGPLSPAVISDEHHACSVSHLPSASLASAPESGCAWHRSYNCHQGLEAGHRLGQFVFATQL